VPYRKYKSGSRWAFWRWTDVDSEYIRRLHVIKTPWFAVCLHWILKPDPEPYLHDHPVTFLSLILRGRYLENRNGRLVNRRWWNFIRASSEDTHRIEAVAPNTLTLCLMGPKTREWGFHKPMITGGLPLSTWIPWQRYYEAQRQGVQL
jgi:hypothetical protein